MAIDLKNLSSLFNERGMKMVEFMAERWDIPGLDARQVKVRFLHLEFVRP